MKMVPRSEQRVLVTGASSGIGLELAREFARHGHPLILTATSGLKLSPIAKSLSDEHGVDVRSVAADLCDLDSVAKLYNHLSKEGLSIEILVNNAGVGHKGPFGEVPLQCHLETLRLNIESLVTLTHHFLPRMLSARQGRILNTASIAGFMPGPNMAVYHATKAFVLSFSEALATEVRGQGITVTALCPGATDTDFFPRAHAVGSFMFQKGNVMGPREVAISGYRALMSGERVHIAGTLNKAMTFSRRLMPESFLAKMTGIFYEDVKPDKRTRFSGEIAARETEKRG